MDDFIDDLVSIGCFNSLWQRIVAAPLLAIHLLSRPLSADEPVSRDDFLSFSKLAVEGQPTEIKIVLGWLINTRAFTVALPNEKHVRWCHDMNQAMSLGYIPHDDLESMVGRLNRAAFLH